MIWLRSSTFVMQTSTDASASGERWINVAASGCPDVAASALAILATSRTGNGGAAEAEDVPEGRRHVGGGEVV
jgi:hypothetical protein